MPRRKGGALHRPQSAARQAANGGGIRPGFMIRDEVSPDFRRQVYRDDVAFADEDEASRVPMTPDEVAELTARIVAMKARGMSDLAISNEVGRSQTTVGALRRAAGVEGLSRQEHKRRGKLHE